MCASSEDFNRTVLMLGDLALYLDQPDVDQAFVGVIGPSLAASLPEPPPGLLPPGYDLNEGPEYPGSGW
ncbi:hypothetical protein GCM10011579_038720 [Streptomyces albiflavescens]|uniref:Uncharacterized protein n=1 Tax=Streptomyces albiflavescens TaxID=1623582 RepID=A0A917Y559_9ACTN|nr:hypothetical protein [Streptomyces albiflavescens]GGN66857.1 hypothetical protein GCM10011579_038720 [Streptomyces albiflavescens]